MSRPHALLWMTLIAASSATACFEPRERIRTGDDTGGASGAGGSAGTAASGAGATAGSSGAGTGGASGASSSGGSGAMSSGGAGATGGSSSGGAGPGGTAGAGGVAGAAGTGGAPSAPDVALARYPWNGFYTGSAFATQPETFNKPLRPRFVWDVASGATRYELELDDSCSVATMASCAFDSPEVQEQTDQTDFTLPSNLTVKTTTPVGTRYFWRVRACNDVGCSAWSAVRYLNVGRLEQDFNGDGYADLVLFDEVHYGTFAGLGTTTFQLPGEAPTWGDFDGDGYTDLLWSDAGNDVLRVWPGAMDGLSDSTQFTIPNPNAGSELFLWVSKSLGDVNADGYDDLGVALLDLVIGGADDQARIAVYLGGSGALSNPPDHYLQAPNTPSELGAFAGNRDIDGDGYVDLVAGDPAGADPEPREGRVFLFFGSLTGHRPGSVTIPSPADEQDGELGSRAMTADIDGDGFSDVIAMVNGASPRLRIYRGGRDAGIMPQYWSEVALDAKADEPRSGFLTVDQREDIAVGTSSGEMYVLEGASGGLLATRLPVQQTLSSGSVFGFWPTVQGPRRPQEASSIIALVDDGGPEARVWYRNGSTFSRTTVALD